MHLFLYMHQYMSWFKGNKIFQKHKTKFFSLFTHFIPLLMILMKMELFY